MYVYMYDYIGVGCSMWSCHKRAKKPVVQRLVCGSMDRHAPRVHSHHLPWGGLFIGNLKDVRGSL